MFFIFLISFLLIAFAAFIYFQDGTDFIKLTNYSVFDLLFNKEAQKLNNIYKALQKVDGEHRILLNIHIQEGTNVHKIPAVLVHESGIHVISTLDKDGWIIGSDRSSEWINILYKNKRVHFENPILTNRRFVYALRDTMPEIPERAFMSVVVFSDGCSFQKVEISLEQVEVLKLREMGHWAQSLVGESLTAADIQTIYQALEGKMVFQKKVVVNKKKKKTPITEV